MAQAQRRERWFGRGFGRGVDRGGGRREPSWTNAFSLAALLLAVLVAILVALVRPDPAPAPAAFALQLALPGLGAGAPRSLSELAVEQSSGPAAQTALLNPGESRTILTARRYAAHLVADIVAAPRLAVAPLRSPVDVQVALIVAANPARYRLGVGDEGPVSAAALALEPGEPLPPYFTYETLRGDSVNKIAARFGVEPESILFNNFEIRDPDRLDLGTPLTIPAVDGVVYTVRLGDTLSGIAENYAAAIDDILAFPGNRLAGPDFLVEGETILLVGGSASLSAGFATGPVYVIPSFRWPMGGVLTSFFGSPRASRLGFHAGIDLSAPSGTFIGAAAPGIVIQAGWDGSYGLSVIVDHGGGVITRYAHMNHIDVFLGAFVDSGTLLGFVGSTGLSSGPHLHFEIIMGGAPVDPLVWLNS